MKLAQPKAIGLIGRQGAGKNATADILSRYFGYRQTSFAEALRVEVALFTMVPGSRVPHDIIMDPQLEELAALMLQCRGMDPWEKPTNARMRRLLQLYGTEYRRKQDENYWLRQVEVDCATVISDARFINEIDLIRGKGGCLWFVERSSVEKTEEHQSEKIGAETADYLIMNDGTLKDLEEQVKAAMQWLSGVAGGFRKAA